MILHCPNVGILFTHGIQLHRQLVVFLSWCISECISVSCSMLILGRDVG